MGTIVVHEKELEELRPPWQAPQAAEAVRYGAAALSAEEFALIETFLNRREALAPEVRYRMAEQNAGQIKAKLTRPEGGLISSEELLEAVAYERRSAARFGRAADSIVFWNGARSACRDLLDSLTPLR